MGSRGEGRGAGRLYPNCDMSIWLRSCVSEVKEPVRGAVHKEIPPWLEGSLLRNGPGCLRVGDSEFQHLFDGLALLHRFHISNGSVTYQNSFLKSQTYQKNMAAQRIVVSEFGTKAVPDPCHSIFQRISAVFERLNNQSDNAMISIYPFGDEYFAMTETPIVHKIDASDLSTKDRIDIGRLIGIISHTSHPHITETKAIYNLGMILSKRGPKYCILEFSGAKGSRESVFETGKIVASLPSRWRFHPSYMHTFGITENYFVIVEQPLSVSLCGVVVNSLANRPLSNALKWYENEATVFYVIERGSGKLFRKFIADPLFYLHIINQYEENDRLVVDICCYKNPSMINCMYIKSLKEGQQNPDYATMFRGRPYRFVMPLKPENGREESKGGFKTESEAFHRGGRVRIEPEILCDLGCETPRINYEKFSGRKYRYFYAISSDVDLGNPGTLIKVDVQTKSKKTWSEDGIFPSEPIFVPRPDSHSEDDGVILSALVWGGEKKTNQVGLLILDAVSWTEIGRAVFKTDGPVPKCLHGWFVNENGN